MDAPFLRRRLRVASSPLTRATTISPETALSVLLDDHEVAVEDAGLDHRVALRSRARSARRRRACFPAPASGRVPAGSPRWACRRRSCRAWEVRGCRWRRRAWRRPPSTSCGLKGARPLGGAAAVACCGSLITSSARARCGRRRRKPRSSSAVISRWMPDLDARSSASFISSNEGETPVSLIRSWMNMSSSCCLRVSMARTVAEQSANGCRCSLGVPALMSSYG